MEYVNKKLSFEENNNEVSTDWSQERIRSLRLRLGWSQAEFARRLSLDPADVEFMEKGVLLPNSGLRGELEIIMRQVEENCEEKRQAALRDGEVPDRL